jgi:hypothetical protein
MKSLLMLLGFILFIFSYMILDANKIGMSPENCIIITFSEMVGLVLFFIPGLMLGLPILLKYIDRVFIEEK